MTHSSQAPQFLHDSSAWGRVVGSSPSTYEPCLRTGAFSLCMSSRVLSGVWSECCRPNWVHGCIQLPPARPSLTGAVPEVRVRMCRQPVYYSPTGAIVTDHSSTQKPLPHLFWLTSRKQSHILLHELIRHFLSKKNVVVVINCAKAKYGHTRAHTYETNNRLTRRNPLGPPGTLPGDLGIKICRSSCRLQPSPLAPFFQFVAVQDTTVLF